MATHTPNMMLPIDRERPIGAVVVGRAGMDLYPDPDGVKISEATAFAAELGGSAGNIAVALARQAVPTALLSALSDDAVGRFVRAILDKERVDTSGCRLVGGGRRTSLALAETRPTDAEVVIYRNGAADFELVLDQSDEALVRSASVLILTGTALAAEPSRSSSLALLGMARKSRTFSILDIDHRSYSWAGLEEARRVYREAAALCDAVVGNDEEFAIIAGSRDSGLDAAADLVERGAHFAIFKMGIAGSVTLFEGGRFETGIVPVTAKKPFGAGDAFLGGVVAGLVRGISLEDAVKRGTAAAAIVVSRRGCASAMPGPRDIDALIAENGQEG